MTENETPTSIEGVVEAAVVFGSLLGDAPPETPPTDPNAPAAPTLEQAAAEKRVHRFKVGEEEVEVDDEELRRGWLRQKDYTQKTQRAAETRKKAEAELAEGRRIREAYAQHLDQLSGALERIQPQEPDWKALPPEEYARVDAQWKQFAAERQNVRAEQERVRREMDEDHRRQEEEILADERAKTLEAIPEWRDPAKAREGKAQLREWLTRSGFADDEIDGVTDHRVLKVLHDAMRFDALQSQKPNIRPRAPTSKTLVPGSPSTAKPPDSKSRAFDSLRRSGRTGRNNIDEAARALSHLID